MFVETINLDLRLPERTMPTVTEFRDQIQYRKRAKLDLVLLSAVAAEVRTK